MQLKVLFCPEFLHSRIAPRLRQGDLHRLAEQVEAIDLLCSLLGRLWVVEDDEGLALCLQVGLGNDVDDISKL